MRKPSLTRKNRYLNNTLASIYRWHGHDIPVYDSARNGILIIELFQDEDLDPSQKTQLLIQMLFPDPAEAFALAGDDYNELLWDIVWEAFGLDITPDQSKRGEYQDPIFDWEEDATRIKASFLQCYGIPWETVSSEYSYTDACALLGAMLESDTNTSFREAVAYRSSKPPKRTKYNKDQYENFIERKRYFELHSEHSRISRIQKENNIAADRFAAAKRAAQGAHHG